MEFIGSHVHQNICDRKIFECLAAMPSLWGYSEVPALMGGSSLCLYSSIGGVGMQYGMLYKMHIADWYKLQKLCKMNKKLLTKEQHPWYDIHVGAWDGPHFFMSVLVKQTSLRRDFIRHWWIYSVRKGGFRWKENTLCPVDKRCFFSGTSGETRTHYLALRRRTLYPGELRRRMLCYFIQKSRCCQQ